jgi:hypothetical protein
VEVGTNGDEQAEDAPRWFGTAQDVLALAPAVAAASVALLYTVGALLFSARILGTDLSPGDALTFVPLQQVLARGVGTVVAASIVIPSIGLSLWGVIHLDRLPIVRRERTRWSAGRVLTLAVGVVLVIAGLLSMPPLIGAGLGATGVVLALLGRARKPSPLAAYLALLSAALVLLVAAAFLDPSPLPRATIRLNNGSDLRGGLVVHGDGTWVIASQPKRLTAVNDDDVVSVVVDEAEHRVRSTYEMITGHRPPLGN